MRTLHFGLRVADLERSLAFYRAIGYEVVGSVTRWLRRLSHDVDQRPGLLPDRTGAVAGRSLRRPHCGRLAGLSRHMRKVEALASQS